MFCYRKATLEDLETIWDHSIAQNPDDARYLRWKESFISRNRKQEAATFVAVKDGEPVGEVTLDLLASGYSGNRNNLADGKTTGYVTALRIRQEYEGQGHISRLMKVMENYAITIGLSKLTISVEAAETRNLAIYLHMGYDDFVMAEENDGALVLFYAKML